MKRRSLTLILFISISASAGPTADDADCTRPLGNPARAAAQLKRSNLYRFVPRSTRALPDHGGFEIVTRDPRRRFETVVFDDLIFNSGVWPREGWPSKSGPFVFTDVGHVHLADDAIAVNSFVLSAMTDPEVPNLRLLHSFARAKDLRDLHRFRDVFAGADRDGHTSMVDTMGLSRRVVRWSAGAPEIEEALIVSVQIHYGTKIDYVNPDVETVIHHLEFADRPVRSVPVLRRPRDRDRTFRRDFAAMFGRDRVCEFTVPKGRLIDLPESILARLLFQIMDRVEERGCAILITVQPLWSGGFLRRHNFTRWRTVPDDDAPWLYYLRVRSPEFIFTYDDLQRSGVYEVKP